MACKQCGNRGRYRILRGGAAEEFYCYCVHGDLARADAERTTDETIKRRIDERGKAISVSMNEADALLKARAKRRRAK